MTPEQEREAREAAHRAVDRVLEERRIRGQHHRGQARTSFADELIDALGQEGHRIAPTDPAGRTSTPSEQLYGLGYVDAVDKAVRLARLADRSPGWSDDGDPEMVAAMAALSSAYSAVARHLRAHDDDARAAADEARSAMRRAHVPSKDGP